MTPDISTEVLADLPVHARELFMATASLRAATRRLDAEVRAIINDEGSEVPRLPTAAEVYAVEAFIADLRPQTRTVFTDADARARALLEDAADAMREAMEACGDHWTGDLLATREGMIRNMLSGWSKAVDAMAPSARHHGVGVGNLCKEH